MGSKLVRVKRKWYIIDDVNPQPWAIGPLGVGRRVGGVYPFIGPNQQLVSYQSAVREELADFDATDWTGDIQLEFFFWRRIEIVKRGTKQSRSHQADTTNLQKALEDALQGVFFANDRAVRDVRSIVVEQSQTTIPRIAICISEWEGMDPSLIPDKVWAAIESAPSPIASNNSWKLDSEDIF